jgi:hypothetical protein
MIKLDSFREKKLRTHFDCASIGTPIGGIILSVCNFKFLLSDSLIWTLTILFKVSIDL